MSLFLSELALRSSRAYFVARVGRDVVGYGGLMMTADDGHVTTLAVDPRWHRHKIGTRLLLVLAREAIARGRASLTLEVRLSNLGAQELYRRFGFAPVGVRKGYYVETNEDALVMWAHEVNGPSTRRCSTRSSARSPARPSWRNRSDGGDRCGSSASRRRATRPPPRSSRTAGRSARRSCPARSSCTRRYGGVVPEIASRAHVELINPVIDDALVEAGTSTPGSSTPSPPATARASPARCSSA